MTRVPVVMIAALACLAWQSPAILAQPAPPMFLRCHPIAPGDIARGLAQRYGEERRVVARASDGMLLTEIYVSSQHGTWTLVLRSTAGTACVLLVGDGWQELGNGQRAGLGR